MLKLIFNRRAVLYFPSLTAKLLNVFLHFHMLSPDSDTCNAISKLTLYIAYRYLLVLLAYSNCHPFDSVCEDWLCVPHKCVLLWSPYVIGQTIIFSCCGLLWSPYVIVQTIIFSSCFFLLLWSPYGIGRPYIFSSCFFLLSSSSSSSSFFLA